MITKIGYKPFMGARATRELFHVYVDSPDADGSDGAIAVARYLIGNNALILEVSGVTPEELAPVMVDPKTSEAIELPRPRVYRMGEVFEGPRTPPALSAATDPETGALVAPTGRPPVGDDGDTDPPDAGAVTEGADATEAARILAALQDDGANAPFSGDQAAGQNAQLEDGVKPKGPRKTKAEREAELAARVAEREARQAEEAKRAAEEAGLSDEERKLREGE